MNTIGVFLRILNIVLMIGLPCLIVLLLFRRGKNGFRPIWIGALAFVLSQVGHIPFNQFLLMPGLRELGVDLAAESGVSLIILGLAAGLSAGVFEEVTRFLVFRYWLKGEPDTLLPLKYGAGHGGIEAVLAGLLSLLALVQVLVFTSNAALAAFPAEEAAMIRSQIEAYWAVPLNQSLLGAWERVSALLFHLGASLLVYKSVIEKKPFWLMTAILGHTAMDALAVIGVKKLNFFLLEGMFFIFAAAWGAFTWKVRVRGSEQEVDYPAFEQQAKLQASQVTPEQLDDSRYE